MSYTYIKSERISLPMICNLSSYVINLLHYRDCDRADIDKFSEKVPYGGR